VPLVRHAGEYRGDDERAEPCPEPVFIRADAMGVGHLAGEPTTYNFGASASVSQKYPRGVGPPSEGVDVPVCLEGRQGRRTPVQEFRHAKARPWADPC
jgi:hypothetical protein